MKIIIALIVLLFCRGFLLAKSISCEALHKSNQKDLLADPTRSLTKLEIKQNYANCLENKKITKEYWKWRIALRARKIKDGYIIPKNTLNCPTRKRLIATYNWAITKGGVYTRAELWNSNTGCTSLSGWSVARIIETKKGSNVVKIQLQLPHSDYVTERYVMLNSLIPEAKFEKGMAH